MHVEVVMPKLGESLQEGTIVRWRKQVGEPVALEETLLEIATDKVSTDLPAPVAGVLLKILAQESEVVPVGAPIAVIGEASASPSEPTDTGADRKGVLSPAVRALAKELGTTPDELAVLAGSGAGGRITKQDLLAYAARREAGGRAPSPAGNAALSPEVVQLDELRREMARRMALSVHTAAHASAIFECDMSQIAKLRRERAEHFLRQEGYPLTYLPFVIKAVERVLQKFRWLNGTFDGERLLVSPTCNIGVVVAGPRGPVVPVIRNVGSKSLVEIARSLSELVGRARENRLCPEDVQGGTFTISNFGAFGGLTGTPILYHPQVGVLGFGAVTRRPVVATNRDGIDEFIARDISLLTLSFDHRIIDGAQAGGFLASLVEDLGGFDAAGQLPDAGGSQ